MPCLPLRVQGGALRHVGHGVAWLVGVAGAVRIGGPGDEPVMFPGGLRRDERRGLGLVLAVQFHLHMAGDGDVDAVAVEFAADDHVPGDDLAFDVLRRVHIGLRREDDGGGGARRADAAMVLAVLRLGVGQIVDDPLIRPVGVFGMIDTVHVQLRQSNIVRAFGVHVHDETGFLPQRGGHTITLQFLRVNVDMSDITVGVDVTLVHVGEIMGRVGFRSFRPLG